MSADFLANLALRAIEHDLPSAGSVQPRIASLFEAGLGASGRLDDRLATAEVEEDRVAVGPGAERPWTLTDRREAPPTAPAQPATTSENLDVRLVEVVNAVRSPQHNSPLLSPRPSPTGTFGTIAGPALERTEGETDDFSIRPQAVRIAGGSGSPLVTPVLSTQGQEDSASRGEEWRSPAQSPRPFGARVAAVQPPAARLPANEHPPASSGAPEPVIQVTIGRIEVRATQAPPAARKAGPSAQPATLDEYQKQRSQRGGGQ